jgi:sporulation protein YlmC with PRC-barrel domain
MGEQSCIAKAQKPGNTITHTRMNFQNYAYTSEIIGQSVQNSLGQEYGKVSDVILSATHRRALALVVKKGGFLGIGADYFVLPWQMVQINPNTKRVLVEADRKTIEDTPLVELDKVKGGDFETLNLVFNYYGVDKIWDQPQEDPSPMDQDYNRGEDTGERLPSNEGSYQITQNYPDQRESHIREEANYDKIQGMGESNKKQ